MKGFYTFLLTTIFCSILNSQTPNFVWANNFGSSGLLSQGIRTATDGSGNVYVIGVFDGTVDFDPSASIANLTTTGGDDIFLAKYTSTGAYVWAFKIGSTGAEQGNDIAVDASGNVYITGYFNATADFDPSASTVNLTSAGFTSAYVAKYNSSGVYQWAFKLDASTGAESGRGIELDGSGNLYVTGYFWSTVDFDPSAATANRTSVGAGDIFLAKYTTAGNYVWAISMGSNSVNDDYSNKVCLDALGNVYVVGSIWGITDFDPSASTANVSWVGADDIFLAKYNSSGAYQWAFGIGNLSSDYGYDISTDGSNNVYLTGVFTGTNDFDPSAATTTLTATGNDIILAKYNSSGAYQWAYNIGGSGGDGGWGIFTDSQNYTYITGYFSNTVDFDPSASVANLNVVGSVDIFVAKYNSTGQYQTAFSIGGTGSDTGNGVHVDNSGNIYATGGFRMTADFDPSSSVTNLTSVGTKDIYIAKYCQVPTTPSTINGNANLCAGSTALTYSISVVAGATSYSWSLPSGWSGSSTTNTITATTGTASGNISVTASNACGTSSASVLNVTVNPLPTITASSSNSIICGPPYQGTATISASGANTYTWNTSTTTASISVSPSVTTSYTVTGASAAGCTNTATFTQSVSACTSISQLSTLKAELIVYPNPFSNVITILSGGAKQSITIYNVLGELVHTEIIEMEKTEIDLHKIPSGIYFIKTSSSIQKIIKE